jgi:O-glycosyl hydrolase
MATEACNCGTPVTGLAGWSRAETYVHDILGDLNAWSRGWTDWNILLDQQGGPNHVGNYCDAPMVANLTASPPTLLYQMTYYAMGTFSRFLPEGAIRIGLQFTAGTSVLEWSAFLVYTDSSAPDSHTKRMAMERAEREGGSSSSGSEVVIIVFNPTESQQTLSLQAGSWFVSVPVPAHSFHSMMFDAAIFGNLTAGAASISLASPAVRLA